MIKTQSEKYKSATANAYEIKQGIHFPDAVIDAVKSMYEQNRTVVSAVVQDELPYISIKEAETMVVDALKKFDSDLGEHAERILMAEDRVTINLVPQGELEQMYCLQAGITEEHLIQKGMFNEEDRTESGIVNDKFYATIHMDYDGTMDSVVYLAHELGHAIADDLQRAQGNDFANNPAHMEEVQAYFVQNIVRMELEGSDNPAIAQEAKAQYTQEFLQYKSYYNDVIDDSDSVLHGRPPAFVMASSIAQHLTNHPELREYGSQTLLGHFGPMDVSQTLAAVGVERIEKMQEMLASATPKVHSNEYEMSYNNTHQSP